MNKSRRHFLKQTGMTLATCGAGGAVGLISSSSTHAKSTAAFPQPCSSSAWTKHGIVLRPDQPWEGDYIQDFLASVEPLENNRWRIWYAANSPSKGYVGMGIAEGVPGETMVKQRAVLSEGKPEDAPLAIGNIPKSWRLVAPTHIRLKDGRHRLYFFAGGKQGGRAVQRYLVAESGDGRRYTVIDPQRPCLYTVWDNTTDKKFQPGQKLEDILSNDGAAVYQLPDGTFEMYVQKLEPIDRDDPRYVEYDNIPGKVRFIDRLTSEDGIKFDKRERKILAPDKDDPIDTQFYMLTVTHTPQGRVGLLGWYRVQSGYMELQYCYSKDGIHWDRVRKPWIPRGKTGEPDSLTIYQPNSLVHHQDKWWFFYTGVNYTHSTQATPKPNEKPESCILLATTPSLWRTTP